MQQDADVLIVGSGPVGLVTALLLARYGVKSILVDRRDGPTNHPKARGITTRTMEIFRFLGVEEAIRAYELPPEARRFMWMRQFTGEELACIVAEPITKLDITPSPFTLVSQNWVEEALHRAVRAEGNIDFRLKTTCTSIEEEPQGVAAHMQDSQGNGYLLRGRYLVAADGAYSIIREAVKIPLIGQDDLGYFCNIYFRADLSPYVAHRLAAAYFFATPELVTRFMLSVDGKELWLLGLRYDPLEGASKEDFTQEACLQHIRHTLGLPDLKPEILRIAFWTMAALMAATFRKGNVLLAGDAAHRLPPTGGLGMNSGIQGAHNFCWKLAEVLRGRAGEALLDTYSQERASVIETNINFSMVNARRFSAIAEACLAGDETTLRKEISDQERHVNSVGVDLGAGYEKGTLIPDGSDRPPLDPWSYVPCARPGLRAPHFRVLHRGKKISVLDLFGEGFVLLAGEEADGFVEAAKSSLFDLVVYQVGRDLEDLSGHWRDLYAIEASGSCLIRPDGYVAWRAKNGSDPADIEEVMRTILRVQTPART